MDALHLPQVALGDNVTLTHIFHNPQNVLHQYNVATSYEEPVPEGVMGTQVRSGLLLA